MQLMQAVTTEEIDLARVLFEEYAASLGFSLCFQNFDQELAELPGKYAPPAGRLLLAYADEDLAGCIALRKLDDETCEMKRLFIRPEFRQHGLGRVLIERIISEARLIGYHRMRLDTLPGKMDSAIRLYERVGFRDVAPYYASPVAGTRYLELAL
jgi:GNAT superfamily N-acetyltransferase